MRQFVKEQRDTNDAFSRFMMALISGHEQERAVSRGWMIGPGEKTLDTYHKTIGRGRYMPHQGERECARRRRALQRGAL